MILVPSPNHEPRPEGALVDMLVLHYTGMKTGAEALERLCDPAAKVSAHYLIAENGDVHSLVAEDRRAWHAGVACWRGHADVNSRSIGIELVNPGHEFGYRPFPEDQMAALVDLARDIVARHRIPAINVVGHSDVAPERKTDPGELFDWGRLAQAGIGVWPFQHGGHGDWPPAKAGPETFRAKLDRIGYCVDGTELATVLTAFQRRFRPARIDGAMDEETLTRLTVLGEILGEGRR